MGCFTMQSKRKNQHYSPEFKVLVVETMYKENLTFFAECGKVVCPCGRRGGYISVRYREYEKLMGRKYFVKRDGRNCAARKNIILC